MCIAKYDLVIFNEIIHFKVSYLLNLFYKVVSAKILVRDILHLSKIP